MAEGCGSSFFCYFQKSSRIAPKTLFFLFLKPFVLSFYERLGIRIIGSNQPSSVQIGHIKGHRQGFEDYCSLSLG